MSILLEKWINTVVIVFGFAGRRRIWWSEGGSVSSPQKSLSILMSFISFALMSNASITPVVCFCFIMPLDLDCDAAANKTVSAIRLSLVCVCVCVCVCVLGNRVEAARHGQWEGQTRLRVKHTFLPRLRGLERSEARACTVCTFVNPISLNMAQRYTFDASLICSVDTALEYRL